MTDHKRRYEQALQLLERGSAKEGLSRLEELASEGHIDSMLRAADCYVRGLGAERDLDSAKIFLGRAAAAGSEVAKRLLSLVRKADANEFDRLYWQTFG